MKKRTKKRLGTWIKASLILLLGALGLYGIFTHQPQAKPSLLSPLSQAPDWEKLTRFQRKITKQEFLQQLSERFTVDSSWQEFIQIQGNAAMISTRYANGVGAFRLEFATNEETPAPSTRSRSDTPLQGLRIVIDPGHLGGRWAKMEERYFQLGNEPPVCEGDLTLIVAKILQQQLTKLGASATLLRSDYTPATPLRPNDFLDSVKADANPKKSAEKLFYRTAEIHARAALVNEKIKPDLVLCLHFNAVAWGDPAKPSLSDASHFHLLINGAYSSEELRYEDQRFAMISKICQHHTKREYAISHEIAENFIHLAKLPIYQYAANSTSARATPHPAVWARNLLANRLYDAPVIFLEPYLMNGVTDYQRIQAGDYPGQRLVAGKPQISIFREYATCVSDGIRRFYQKNPPQPSTTR